MARIPARVDGIDTIVVGYVYGPKGTLAVVVWQNPDGRYGPRDVPLRDLEFTGLPKQLRRRLKQAGAATKRAELQKEYWAGATGTVKSTGVSAG